MNNIIERKWKQNSMVNIEDLRGMAFQAEENAHTFRIRGVDASGAEMALSGSVGAVFLRADNTDVAITGTVEDGVAVITLPEECYDMPGRFGLTVYLTSDGQTVAIYAAIGSVSRTSSGNVSPGSAADVADLINQINAAIEDLDEAIAAIPQDYQELEDDVSGLKNDVDDLDERVTAIEEGYTIEEKTISGGSVATILDGASGYNIKELVFNIDETTSGYTGATVSHSGEDTSNPDTLSISWQTEAGTVCGGTLTLNDDGSADLVKTWNGVTVNDIKAADLARSTGYGATLFATRFYYTGAKKSGVSNVKSDTFANGTAPGQLADMSMCGMTTGNANYVYFRDDRCTTAQEFVNTNGNVVIVYELDEPVTVNLSNVGQIAEYTGTNKFWVNTGDITSLTYTAAVKEGQISIDRSLSIEGDAADAKAAGDAIDNVDTKIEAIRTATSGDVGKVLSVKTVVDNKVTEWDFSDVDSIGEPIELSTTGFYWDSAIIGTSKSIKLSTNSAGICTHITLPAGKTLRITSTEVNTDTLSRMFFSYDASTDICIDKADKVAMGIYKTYFLRYEVDADVYINAKASNNYAVNMSDVTNPLADIGKMAGVTQPSILEINDSKYLDYAIRSLKWPQRTGSDPNQYRKPAVFLHFSDIHEGNVDLKRIVEFSNEHNINPSIDGIICSGDIVYDTLTDGMSFFSGVTGSNSVMLVPGNHDAAIVSGGSKVSSTPLETYNVLFTDRISNWGVTQPTDAATNGLCYFYKDYSSYKLRVIFLDGNSHNDPSYITAEDTWLATTLSGAKTLEYAVICVDHFPFKPNSFSMVDCSFSPRYAFNQPSGYIPDSFVDTVESFIGGGGEFVCWLAGHWHQDYVMLHNDGHQLCIGVACATHENRSNLNITYCDSLREANTKGQDLFNLVGIDTLSKNISIFRVGCDLTRLMNSRKHLCIDYANRTVVWND